MNLTEIDKVFLNHLRTNEIPVSILTTGEHNTTHRFDNVHIAAFTPVMLILELRDYLIGTTQCSVFLRNIISIIPKKPIKIIFDHKKGEIN